MHWREGGGIGGSEGHEESSLDCLVVIESLLLLDMVLAAVMMTCGILVLSEGLPCSASRAESQQKGLHRFWSGKEVDS